MPTETIIAIYDTPAHAELAVADLERSGIPTSSIQSHTRDHFADTADGAHTSQTYDPAREQGSENGGFWSWLFGDEQSHTHNHTYDREMQAGSTVVTVIADQTQAPQIISILEEHAPVDLEERDAQHGMSPAHETAASTIAATHTDTNFATSSAGTNRSTDTAHEEVIPLSEESLRVGKREIDRGTTRVHRYVVERPVEEQVRLRDERISVFRRPASGTAPGTDAFTNKTLHVTETAEEAVVDKSVHVVEEVVVQKQVGERTETVRDTIRREEVEITGPGGKPHPTT